MINPVVKNSIKSKLFGEEDIKNLFLPIDVLYDENEANKAIEIINKYQQEIATAQECSSFPEGAISRKLNEIAIAGKIIKTAKNLSIVLNARFLDSSLYEEKEDTLRVPSLHDSIDSLLDYIMKQDITGCFLDDVILSTKKKRQIIQNSDYGADWSETEELKEAAKEKFNLTEKVEIEE